MKRKLAMISAFFAMTVVWPMPSIQAQQAVNFNEHIAPIIHSKCTSCHRKDQAAPFPLSTFQEVRDRAETIQAVVDDNYMPPWKPVNQNIHFSNDRRLASKQKQLIEKWVESGMKQGPANKAKKIPKFPTKWMLGKPDMVVKMNGRFQVPASGPDIYRSFVFPLNLPEDKWIKALELRPSARSVVHHGVFFVDKDRNGRLADGKDGKAGVSGMGFLRPSGKNLGRNMQRGQSFTRSLGGYVPGSTPNKLPGDLAFYLPAGSDIVMNTHFHPSGKVETEQSELAIYFADKKPKKEIVPIQVPALFGISAGIDVPAGAKNFKIETSFRLHVALDGVQIGGHAHYICKSMKLTATKPGGQSIPLLKIDDWDLDWQDQYQFKQPVSLPAGTVLKATIIYDNSADNASNPYSPPRRIKWGKESYDEMGSLNLLAVAGSPRETEILKASVRKSFADAIKAKIFQRLPKGQLKNFQRALSGRLFRFLDRNRDGKYQKSEIPQNRRERFFQFFDSNGDQVVDKAELEEGKRKLQMLIEATGG